MTGLVIGRRLRLAAAALLLLAWALPAAAQRPHVHLVATGGTISGAPDHRLTHDELLGSVPDVDRYAEATSEQFANVASGSLTLDQWLELARRLNGLFEADARLAGIVVTAGTDTMEELAYFLHLTVRDMRPVVLVGAMRPPADANYDGPANLLAGFRVAANPASRERGVLVVLNGDIHGARSVTKGDARRLDAFESPQGPLGQITSDRITYSRMRAAETRARRHTAWSEFDVDAIETLPRVDVLLSYQDAPGDLVEAAVDLGAKGVVLAVLGAGATSGTQNAAIAYAGEHGVVVVRSSRTGGGRVVPLTASSPTTLTAGDLTPIKARVLLMLALTASSDPAEIQRIFEQY